MMGIGNGGVFLLYPVLNYFLFSHIIRVYVFMPAHYFWMYSHCGRLFYSSISCKRSRMSHYLSITIHYLSFLKSE